MARKRASAADLAGYPPIGGVLDGFEICDWPEAAVGGQGRVAFAKDSDGREVALKFEDSEHEYWDAMSSGEERYWKLWREWKCGMDRLQAERVFKKLFCKVMFGPCSDRWLKVADRRHGFESEIRILRENTESRNPIAGLPRFLRHGVYRWKDSKGRSRQRYYFAMERLSNLGTLPTHEGTIAELMIEICGVLKDLHRRKIYHQDIKEANLMSRPKTGELVLIDFGISSQERGLRGTPGYAAPEIIAGGEASASTDIFSMGVLISQCFRGDIPPSWQKIVNVCLRVSAHDRYHKVDALERAIQQRSF